MDITGSWEKAFIISLVRLRDHLEELNPEEIVGHQKQFAIEELICCYFGDRRERIPVPVSSFLMNCEDMADYINNIVLDYIFDESDGFLLVDWRKRYVLKEENYETNIFDEDDEP